jgi:hypothetical protein
MSRVHITLDDDAGIDFKPVRADKVSKFFCGCIDCGKIYGEGSWAILFVSGEIELFTGAKAVQPVCCNYQISSPYLFKSRKDAAAQQKAILERIAECRHVKDFLFFPKENFLPTAIH